ncbi:hypothetical protein MMC17_007736 [Xylographa soralifera]|nr:hypothetical protein [Xylographa soralifera]
MATRNLTNLLPELLDLILAPFLVVNDPVIIPEMFGYSSFHGFSVRARPKSVNALKLQPSVLLICKALHDVGMRILYQKNRFHFMAPQGLYTFAATIGKKYAGLVSQISIYAPDPEFRGIVLNGMLTTYFPNLNRITLDRRMEGRGIVARSILHKITNKEQLEKALREQVGPRCQIAVFPAK